MIKIRRSNERGSSKTTWLDSKHTFSFGDYHSENNMGFRSLRVINEDYIAPNSGFGEHPHRNMEIITYVISGTLSHKDNMGNESKLTAGKFQAMAAGKGVIHSEYNNSSSETVHLLQIWIVPESKGITPTYQEIRPELKRGLTLVASDSGRNRSMRINQDADLYFGALINGDNITYNLNSDRGVWLQMISGELEFSDGTLSHRLFPGDGASFEGRPPEIKASTDSTFLLFDLA